MKGEKVFVRFNAKDFDPADVRRCFVGGESQNDVVGGVVTKAFWDGVLVGLLLAVGALLIGWFLVGLF